MHFAKYDFYMYDVIAIIQSAWWRLLAEGLVTIWKQLWWRRVVGI